MTKSRAKAKVFGVAYKFQLVIQAACLGLISIPALGSSDGESPYAGDLGQLIASILIFLFLLVVLKKWAWKIGQAYNQSFVQNWEYYPLTDNEIKFVLDDIMVVAVPDLIKVITYDDKVVGFLLAFPDISAALQRHDGKLNPLSLIAYLREQKRTDWISFNGIGILPEYQGFGGNALLFSEIYETAHSSKFIHGELTQIAESAKQMRKDLINLGVKPYKNHRIYGREI